MYTEPHIRTVQELHKPDLIISTNNTSYVVDAQVINDRYNLNTAHDFKTRKYKHLTKEIKALTGDEEVKYTSITLSWRGIRSPKSHKQSLDWKLLNTADIKPLSTHVLVGGVTSFRTFQSTTATIAGYRRGIG